MPYLLRHCFRRLCRHAARKGSVFPAPAISLLTLSVAVALVVASTVSLSAPVSKGTTQEQHQATPAGQPAGQNTGASMKRAAGTADASDTLAVREIDVLALRELLQPNTKQPRPLLVNFWATWCDPCREEFPDLVRIDADYRARGLEFITISLDDTSQINTNVPQFLREKKASMPAYLLNTLDPDAAIEMVDRAWRGALPATFLYDARGQIVFKHMGRVKAAELRAAIEKVLSEK